MDRIIKRGNLFYAELKCGIGSEQHGYRPVLIISNDIGNRHSDTVIVAMITSKTERKYVMPTHCRIQAQQGLARISYIMLEQLQTIDKARLKVYIGMLNDKTMRKVNRALAISVGLK